MQHMQKKTGGDVLITISGFLIKGETITADTMFKGPAGRRIDLGWEIISYKKYVHIISRVYTRLINKFDITLVLHRFKYKTFIGNGFAKFWIKKCILKYNLSISPE